MQKVEKVETTQSSEGAALQMFTSLLLSFLLFDKVLQYCHCEGLSQICVILGVILGVIAIFRFRYHVHLSKDVIVYSNKQSDNRV